VQEADIVARFALPDGSLRFSHEAMATVFEILVVNDDADYASRAAYAAFDELDMIEAHLSRFLETSDISMVNALLPGQSLVLGPAAYQCIRTALEISAQTDGAFDITIGSLVDTWRDTDTHDGRPNCEEYRRDAAPAAWEMLKLDDAARTISVGSEGIELDLGGIGKGFAVDRMGEILRDWGVPRSLVHGGTSTVLALDGPNGDDGWSATLSHPRCADETIARVDLRRGAISGSGIEKGAHIIDPNAGWPAPGRFAAWSFSPNATWADGLSTAFMVMDLAGIQRLCTQDSAVGGIVVLDDGKVERFCRLPSVKQMSAARC